MIQGPSVMYSTQQHQAQQSSMDNMVSNVVDGSGTINPAALNQAGVLATPTSLTDTTSPRGTKRSRSPEQYTQAGAGPYDGDNDDLRPKKRGRAPKENAPDDLIIQATGQSHPTQLPTPVTAHGQHQPQLPQTPQHASTQQTASAQTSASKQSSPTKPAAGKGVVKALPTVRDHTTDQLNTEKDEYIPREIDDAGEGKVQSNGRLIGNREYKCRTFLVPNRGDKLFMLATECARILGYRDSYLLFNKNRSLYKIIATQPEKDDLIHQDILPYSYRSRQIAIVTAKSMFRQFGSRVVVNGRRVRDDYWEAKARKQGFTEEDMAGEKRPGAAKREAQAQADNAAVGQPHANIEYVGVQGGPPMNHYGMPPQYIGTQMHGGISHENRLPMIDPSYAPRDYSDITRPRQELTGAPYQDRTLPSTMNEMLTHASTAQEFNKSLTAQRGQRANILNDYWKKEHPTTSPVQDSTAAPTASHAGSHLNMNSGAQPGMLPPQAGQAGYPPHGGSQQGSPQAMRSVPPNMPQRSPMPGGYGQGIPPSPNSGYGYNSSQFQYQQQQQQQQQHSMAPYGSPHTPSHPQQQPPSPHPSQSPQQHMSPAASGHAGQPGMPPPQGMYAQMQPMGGMQQNYGGMGRPIYQAQASHGYMPNSGPAPGGMTSNWAGGQQNWQPQY